MTLSPNEFRARAIEFAREYRDAASERADAQLYWRDFFPVSGIGARRVGAFKQPVRGLPRASAVISDQGHFRALIARRTALDGNDLSAWIARLHDMLNIPVHGRQPALDTHLNRVVDASYARPRCDFSTEAARLAILCTRHQARAAPLHPVGGAVRRSKIRKSRPSGLAGEQMPLLAKAPPS